MSAGQRQQAPGLDSKAQPHVQRLKRGLPKAFLPGIPVGAVWCATGTLQTMNELRLEQLCRHMTKPQD